MNTQVAKVFKALSDPTRIEIILKLLKNKESSCQELMAHFPLSQPTLSHHFNKLADCQLILQRKDGANHYYRVNKPFLTSVGINVKVLSQKLEGGNNANMG